MLYYDADFLKGLPLEAQPLMTRLTNKKNEKECIKKQIEECVEYQRLAKKEVALHDDIMDLFAELHSILDPLDYSFLCSGEMLKQKCSTTKVC